MAVKDLVARLRTEDSGATAGIGKYAAGIAGIGIAVAVAGKALSVMTNAVKGLTDQVKQSVAAAAVQEDAERALGSAIRIAGNSAKEILPGLKAYASELQDLTGVGDEVILSNQRLLVSVGKLEGEGLKRATRAAIDLSKSQGISLRTSFDLVAKAATGYTSTLSRYGIILDESIPASEKFGAALDKIEKIAGGSAALALDTYTGRMAEFDGRIGDLREAIGGPFKDAIKVVVENLSPLIKGFTDSVSKSKPFREAVLNAAAATAEFAALLIDAVANAIGFGKTMAKVGFAGFDPFIQLLSGGGGVISLMKELGFAFEGADADNPLSRALRQTAETLRRMAEDGDADTVGGEIDAALGTEGSAKAVAALNAELDALEEKLAAASGPREAIAGPGATSPDANIDTGLISQQLLDDELDRIVEHNENIKSAYTDATIARIEAEAAILELYGQSALEKDLAILELRRQQELDAAEEIGLMKRDIEDRYDLERRMLIKRSTDYEVSEAKRAAAEKIRQQVTMANAALNLAETVFGQSKATAIAQAIINTYEGASKALAQGGIYGVALAAIVIATGLAQVAKIKSSQPQEYASGGIVGGRSSSPYDTQMIAARPGEAILPPGLTSLLLEAAGGGGGRGTEVVLTLEGGAWDAVASELTARVRSGSVELESSRVRSFRSRR